MFKINDRVKVIIPTDKDKATLQDNYFAGWQVSPIGKYGRVTEIQEPDWVSIKLDSPATGLQENWEELNFPEWELELVEGDKE